MIVPINQFHKENSHAQNENEEESYSDSNQFIPHNKVVKNWRYIIPKNEIETK